MRISKEIEKQYTVVFDETCRYSINELSCVNKLFGFTHGLFGVHKESDRIGWTYNADEDTITLWVYSYINSKLHKKSIANVRIGDKVLLRIKSTLLADGKKTRTTSFYMGDALMYTIAECDDAHTLVPQLHIGLGPYFGGNSVAPHTIYIHMDKTI